MSKLIPKPRPSTTSSEAQKFFSAYLQQSCPPSIRKDIFPVLKNLTNLKNFEQDVIQLPIMSNVSGKFLFSDSVKDSLHDVISESYSFLKQDNRILNDIFKNEISEDEIQSCRNVLKKCPEHQSQCFHDYKNNLHKPPYSYGDTKVPKTKIGLQIDEIFYEIERYTKQQQEFLSCVIPQENGISREEFLSSIIMQTLMIPEKSRNRV
ncbi:7321_t:CDS:2 [Cetraspora pellucida]|uniref:7321_t:CDS:1 n=1 Tax=Cetraspora pellucida TaxID=1433469 RepID=A0ACA9KPW9_9GLOM|nr:7321_t:CDS:2 [Cetraspora pellucida]